MSDAYAYRASADLASALREYAAADNAFRATVVAYDGQNPGCRILWAQSPFSADMHPMGFEDTTDDVPEGLSRRRGRRSLIPKRGRAGEPWQAVLDEMAKRPRVEKVYQRFGVPTAGRGGSTGTGGHYLAPTRFLDGGDAAGVLVACKYDLATNPLRDTPGQGLGKHLTPVPLSEFYAVKERLERDQAATTEEAPA